MRLTTKITYNYITPDNVENIDIKCLNKLGQLEDIEEELGIDLITFFKYLSAEEVFYIDDFGEVGTLIVRSIDKKGIIVFQKGFSWGECDFHLYFQGYGKTWALTKEELL